jgi:hypothetical protein
MRKLAAALLIVSLQSSGLLADFSRSEASLHPAYPGSAPFILEIGGVWPSDCHPGEQLPVVQSFDGLKVEIEYEIIVVHITCNETDTPYRSLVDMTEAVRTTKPLGDALEVRVHFQGATFRQSLDLNCPDRTECADTSGKWPLIERGLYVTPDRSREGMLVARQDGATVIYPLVYGDSGNAEWLFSSGRVSEDTYFAELSLWTGGDCFDCLPTDAEPVPVTAGHLSVLIESPDTMQVKINERPFSSYSKLVYGFETFQLDPPGAEPLVDLLGRWALNENRGTDPPLGDLSNFLPPAFDIESGNAPGVEEGSYSVKTITGEELGQLFCKTQVTFEQPRNVCEFIDPTDQAEPLLLFYPDGPSSVSIEYGRPVIAIGIPPGGRAVRLD